MDLEQEIKQWMSEIKPLISDEPDESDGSEDSELTSLIHDPKTPATTQPAKVESPVVSRSSSFGANVLARAKADMGVTEELGDNDGKRIREYFRYYNMAAGQPWCAAAISAWMKEAGGGPIAGAVGVREILRQFTQAGRYVPRSKITPDVMIPGNIAMWSRGPNPSFGHIGIIDTSDGKNFTSIEGNSGPQGKNVVKNSHTVNDATLLGIGLLSDYSPSTKSSTANYAVELANLFYKKAIY